MKKKDYLSKNDHDEWEKFIEDKSKLPDKDKLNDQTFTKKKFVFDLHGFALEEANNFLNYRFFRIIILRPHFIC